MTYNDREAWLHAATSIMRPWFTEAGFPVPEKLRIGVGYGPDGARIENRKGSILGVTLHTSCSADGINEIWVSPEHATTEEMLGTLIHELIHAALNNADGHRGRFQQCAVKLGLNGPMTATTAGLELMVKLKSVADQLGAYPGAVVNVAGLFQPDAEGSPAGGKSASGPGKQGTRMLKLTCESGRQGECECEGYVVRTTRKMLRIGNPSCPFGGELTEE